MNIIFKLLMLFIVLAVFSGCWSFEKPDPRYDDANRVANGTFICKWEAQIYASHMRRKGYTVYLNKNNWFNNGGYFWNVYVEKSNKEETGKEQENAD